MSKYKQWIRSLTRHAEVALDRAGEEGALQWMKDTVPASSVVSLDIHKALGRARKRRLAHQPKETKR
jgi:hypothetical protein